MARYYSAKADANQAPICAELRQRYGDTIDITDVHMVKNFCDFVLLDKLTRCLYTVEVKMPGKERDLSSGNVDFLERYDMRLPYIMVANAEQMIDQIELDRAELS